LSAKVKGGKSIYGASVGILMLDARFPRIPGDMGNATTWPFPVLYRVVRNATPDLVVRQGAAGTLDAFIETARDLVRDGADGITTNCGFLSLFQQELSDALQVPVATSSLMQVDLVNRLLPPGRKAGILTISASTLTPRHLEAAGVPANTPVGSTEGGGNSPAQSSATNSSLMSIWPARTTWRQPRPCALSIPMLAPSCSNAPTWSPMRPT
jgi:hypothetical protein